MTTTATSAKKPMFLLLRNMEFLNTELTAAQLLQQYPRGAYTTCRTVKNGLAVFELEMHLKRLSDTVKLMLPKNNNNNNNSSSSNEIKEQQQQLIPTTASHSADSSSVSLPFSDISMATNYDILAPLVTKAIASGVKAASEIIQVSGELSLTLLLTWDTDRLSSTSSICDTHISCDLYTHISSLRAVPAKPVIAYALGTPRKNALAKDSQWVKDRANIEKLKPVTVNECLLSTLDDNEDGGVVTEGLTSNFFVVIDGIVHTADKDVLAGTVRQQVLKVCKNANIPVRLESPKLSESRKWEAAFITSTTRQVASLDEIVIFTNHKVTSDLNELPPIDHVLKFPEKHELVERIRLLVCSEIDANSTFL